MASLASDVFARRLRVERERRRLSQAELARRVAEILGTNVDQSAVTRIEQQTRAVRLDEAVAIASALGVPLAALLTDDTAHENERLIQEHLAELVVAQREWERLRQEIHRITGTIQALSADRGLLPQDASDDADSGIVLDPGLRDANATQIASEDDD